MKTTSNNINSFKYLLDTNNIRTVKKIINNLSSALVVQSDTKTINHFGRKYPIISIAFYNTKGVMTFLCPFCGKSHYHSRNEGHRSPHCAGQFFEAIFIDDVCFLQKDGYYLKNDKGGFFKRILPKRK